MRVDSLYFGKEVMRTDALVRGFRTGFVELGETAKSFRKGIFDIKADSYTDSGVPFIRISNLRSGIVNDAAIAHISDEAHTAELKTEVRRGDLVMSKTAYPSAAYVQLTKANVSQDVIAYRISGAWKKRLRPGFLAAYFNSAVGITLMQRQFQGNVQLHLSLDDGRKIPIPLIGQELQEVIESALLDALGEVRTSGEMLDEGTRSLLKELGLASWKPEEPLTYLRTSKGGLFFWPFGFAVLSTEIRFARFMAEGTF
jgi:hypothetical protein